MRTGVRAGGKLRGCDEDGGTVAGWGKLRGCDEDGGTSGGLGKAVEDEMRRGKAAVTRLRGKREL